jgi:hypothetical protein
MLVAVVEITSWRLRWRNPGTNSGVMWIEIGRRFDARDLHDVIKVILIVGRVYVTKCLQSSPLTIMTSPVSSSVGESHPGCHGKQILR